MVETRQYLPELGAWDNCVSPLLIPSEAAAIQIGALMPHLDNRHDGSPVSLTDLRFVTESPHHDLLVAIRQKRIVGSTALNLTWGPFEGAQVRIGDVVVHPEFRGQGVMRSLWGGAVKWAREKGAHAINFETETWRTSAREAYQRFGAKADCNAIHHSYEIPTTTESTSSHGFLASILSNPIELSHD